MTTMEPVIKHGLSTWDRAMLPPDEFESRQEELRKLLGEFELRGVIGFENAINPGLVSYETNFRTPAGLTTLLCIPGHDATMLAGLGGTRDHPSIRSMSFSQDLRWFPETGPGIATVLAERGVESGRVGVTGMNDCMSHDQANAILHALANYEIVDFDEHFQLLRRSKRARELSVVRASLAILKDAREATLRDFGDYGDVHTALTIFEKSARLHGCRDVRVLALASDGSLRPWPYVGLGSTWSTEPMTAYVAGEYLGYWCDLAMTSDVSCPSTLLAKEALGVVTSDLHAGTTARSLHEALERQLGTEASNVTLRVTGIGLGLEEAPFLDDQTAITLEGDLLSVRTWARVGQVLSSAIEHVVVGGAGCTKLSLS